MSLSPLTLAHRDLEHTALPHTLVFLTGHSEVQVMSYHTEVSPRWPALCFKQFCWRQEGHSNHRIRKGSLGRGTHGPLDSSPHPQLVDRETQESQPVLRTFVLLGHWTSSWKHLPGPCSRSNANTGMTKLVTAVLPFPVPMPR